MLFVSTDLNQYEQKVAPVLIWSLRIKRTREFNTWEIVRDEDDPIYLNEVLINHLESDAQVNIEQISSEFLDDGLIDKAELIEICYDLEYESHPSVSFVFKKMRIAELGASY